MMILKSAHKKLGASDKKNILFICLVAALPVLQFLIFYVGVNINSVIMAFQRYEIDESTNIGGYAWNGLDNFRRAFSELTRTGNMLRALGNSCVYFLVSVLVGITVSLIFSYYIYKRRKCASFFKVMLFLPSIISSIVLIIIFKQFANFAVPDIVGKIFGVNIGSLLNTDKTAFGTVLFYCIWFGCGSNVLIYLGTMNGIPESLVEACELDGANAFQEFIHVTLPSVYPTVSTFVITALAALFTADMGLYSFYSAEASYSIQTIGYYLLRETRAASFAGYPYLSALGIIFTAVTIPLTILLRKALEKFGPSPD